MTEPDAPPAPEDAEATEPVELSPREQLLEKIGHTDDARGLLDAYLVAKDHFEHGDNRRAAAELTALLDHTPSPELAQAAKDLLTRIKPDRVALAVLATCAVGLAVIWFLAVGAY